MVTLHVAFLVVACIACLLLGYIIGNLAGWVQHKRTPVEDIPVVVEVINRIYYDEESGEYVEETTEYKHNCADLHRPHHLHRVSNFVGPRRKKTEKKKSE